VKPFPLVLSAPSGGGKSTIANALVAAREDLGYSVSATTRPPRPGEQDGVDYHFLTPATFERRVQAGEFLEWAEYGRARYGTLRAEVEKVLASGRHVVLDLEIVGARAIKQHYPDAVLVFVVPPSAEELMQRLGGTQGTRAGTLEARLRRAVEEVSEAMIYDYLVVNADRTEAVAEVAAILDAESRRPCRNPELAEEMARLGRELGALADRIHVTQQGGT
jgi:guanylate kinase